MTLTDNATGSMGLSSQDDSSNLPESISIGAEKAFDVTLSLNYSPELLKCWIEV